MQGPSWARALFQIMGIRGQTLPPRACLRGNPVFISPGCASLVTLLSDVEQGGVQTYPPPPQAELGTEGCSAPLL